MATQVREIPALLLLATLTGKLDLGRGVTIYENKVIDEPASLLTSELEHGRSVRHEHEVCTGSGCRATLA
jgi:hypothetical protein